jgi:hypothetical protein
MLVEMAAAAVYAYQQSRANFLLILIACCGTFVMVLLAICRRAVLISAKEDADCA